MAETSRVPYLGRYLAVLVMMTIAVKIVQWAAIVFLSTLLPDGGLAVIPPMIAALHVGQVWGREQGVIPDNKIAWRWAFVAGLIYLAVQMLVWPLMLSQVEITGDRMILVGTIVAGTTIMAVLLNRLFLTTGAKGAIARP